MAYTPPDDGRKFTELYNVQRLASSNIDPHAQVCISTIQRMYSILSGEAIDESVEDISLADVSQIGKQPKPVRYNQAVPIETFDFIVIDECHRSIYNLWKQMLDYYDAFLIGLTATPDKRTFGFFNQNVVAEYNYEQSVVDGVNVGYDVYEIETQITKAGAELKAKEWVDLRHRETRTKRWAETEEDIAYTGKELDRSAAPLSKPPMFHHRHCSCWIICRHGRPTLLLTILTCWCRLPWCMHSSSSSTHSRMATGVLVGYSFRCSCTRSARSAARCSI
jgi:type I restriction enzyme R subunit